MKKKGFWKYFSNATKFVLHLNMVMLLPVWHISLYFMIWKPRFCLSLSSIDFKKFKHKSSAATFCLYQFKLRSTHTQKKKKKYKQIYSVNTRREWGKEEEKKRKISFGSAIKALTKPKSNHAKNKLFFYLCVYYLLTVNEINKKKKKIETRTREAKRTHTENAH